MQHNQQSVAAAGFARKWAGRGYEKGESQPFWMELIQTVLGVLTVSCRKLLKSDMKESDFIDKEVLDKWYGNAGYHSVYVLEIEKLWK